MDREDMHHLVEEIQSLSLEAAEKRDTDDFGEARLLDAQATALETQLNDAGYELEDDPDDIELIHVLSNGVRVASLSLADWSWQ